MAVFEKASIIRQKKLKDDRKSKAKEDGKKKEDLKANEAAKNTEVRKRIQAQKGNVKEDPKIDQISVTEHKEQRGSVTQEEFPILKIVRKAERMEYLWVMLDLNGTQ